MRLIKRKNRSDLSIIAVSFLTAIFISTTSTLAGTSIPRLPVISDYAQFVSQSVPSTMLPGNKYQISVTFKNTGKSIWTSGGYLLYSQNPFYNNTWLVRSVNLLPKESIRPGQTKTFTFTVSAPSKSGSYNFQWQMYKKGRGFFGQKSDNLIIKVNTPPALDPIDNKTTFEHRVVQFTVSGSDPDNDSLVYSASNLPSGATFDTESHTFSWIPEHGQKGTYSNISFEVSDGIDTISQTMTTEVLKTIVFGTIYTKNPQGQSVPFEGVTIDVLALDRVTILASGTSDAAGHFDAFKDSWPDGNYFIRASKAGYRTYTALALIRANTMMPFSVTLVEAVPPTGSISINDGDEYANSTAVILNLSAQDNPEGSGLSQMQFSNDNSAWSPPESYATTKNWTLSGDDGTKTVYVKFKDAAGNWSETYSDTIVLDTAYPLVVITSPANDAVFDITNITVRYTLDGTPKSKNVVLVNGANTITITEADPAGNAGSAQILVHYNPGTLVDPALGGIVYSPDGQASVEIPPGALSVPTTISVTNLNPGNYTGIAPADYSPQGIVTFRPEGQVFNLPVTIKMPLDKARVPGTEVALGILNTGSGLFELVAGGNMFVASDGISASAKISHFSTYGAFENIVSSGAAIGSAQIPLPDLFTGSFSHQIKIVTPPGRKGIEPNIALLYRSNLRNGWLGYGWDINPGCIERNAKSGIPTYRDVPETLDLGDGSDGELILTEGTTTINGTKNYTKVDIGPNATITCLSWDGSNGGEIIIKCQGDVKIKGRIDVSGKGYRGGAGGVFRGNGFQGESYNGQGGQSMANNYGGGGAGHGSVADVACGGPGAGGGYGTKGTDAPHYWGIAAGGSVYGDAELTALYRGSGGGGGGDDGGGRSGGTGGNGGGAIKIIAKNIVVSDTATVSADGVNGTAGGNYVGGGGGSGGSILLMAEQANIIGRVTAKGGSDVNNGGNGGEGRVKVSEAEKLDTFNYAATGSKTDLVNLIDNLYQSKIESGFVKFYKETDGSWRAVQKDGTKLYFGRSADSKVTNSKGTSKWLLDRIEDTNGNYMTLSYVRDSGQLYLNGITYTGNSTTGALPAHTVDFILEDRNDDIFTASDGATITTKKRLKEINIKVSGALARRYVLNYTYSPDTGKSLLTSIDQYGSDGVTKFPTMTFRYRGK